MISWLRPKGRLSSSCLSAGNRFRHSAGLAIGTTMFHCEKKKKKSDMVDIQES